MTIIKHSVIAIDLKKYFFNICALDEKNNTNNTLAIAEASKHPKISFVLVKSLLSMYSSFKYFRNELFTSQRKKRPFFNGLNHNNEKFISVRKSRTQW